MKRILSLFLLAVSYMLTAYGANNVILSTAEGAPGETVTVTLSLTNSDAVTAVDVTIPLDAQLTYVEGSCRLNNERADGHSLTAGVNGGALRIIVMNLGLTPLVGNEGVLATFDLKLRRQPAVYKLNPTVILSDENGASLPATTTAGAVTILAPRLTVVTSSTDYGHIPIRSTYTRNITLRNDGTSTLNVSNVTFSAEEFSLSEPAFSILAGASRNVTITYDPVTYGAIEEQVTFYSDAINGTQSATLIADPYSVNELHVSNGSGISDEEVEITVRMNNMEPIIAAQWSFKMPKELVYVEGSLTPTDRAGSHTPMTTIKGDTLTMILYTSNNTIITGDDGVLATFKVRPNGKSGYYYLRPIDVVLGNIKLDNMTSATSYGYVNVKSPKLTSNATLNMGNVSVTKSATTTYTVRNSGAAPLTIDRVNFLSEGWESTTPLPITLAVGKSTTLDVTYTPTTAGAYEGVMNIYTNDPDNRMKSVTVSANVYEPNDLTIEGCPTIEGYAIDVALDNYTDLAAIQMDIHWIEGMTSNNSRMALTDRLSGLSATVSDMGENTYRVVIFSLDNSLVNGKEGNIFRLSFAADESTEYIGTTLTIDNIVMSSKEGVNMTSTTSVSHTATNLPGDANGDGQLTISDVVLTANSVLSGTTTGVVMVNADTSGDGELTVTDVVGVANIVLSAQ